MARRSVAVLNSAGIKIGYTTRNAAQADVDGKRAIQQSEGCIRLLPSADPVGWRRKSSDGYVVWQVERRLSLDEGA